MNPHVAQAATAQLAFVTKETNSSKLHNENMSLKVPLQQIDFGSSSKAGEHLI